MNDKEYFAIAKEMLSKSYAPFSKFKVGAALVGKNGQVYTGCNVENSSLGATICAERTAFVKAISEGQHEFEKIVLASSGGRAWPCGICRQFMKDLGEEDFIIIAGDDEDSLVSMTLGEILPEGFRLETK